MESTLDELLTVGDVARLADVVPATVVLASQCGRLPVVARTRRGIRLFRLRDVKRFVEARKAARLEKKFQPVL